MESEQVGAVVLGEHTQIVDADAKSHGIRETEVHAATELETEVGARVRFAERDWRGARNRGSR